jgi:hypothetical protein
MPDNRRVYNTYQAAPSSYRKRGLFNFFILIVKQTAHKVAIIVSTAPTTGTAIF